MIIPWYLDVSIYWYMNIFAILNVIDIDTGIDDDILIFTNWC